MSAAPRRASDARHAPGRTPGVGCGDSFGPLALRHVLAVRLDLNTADEQRRQNGFGLIVRPNADATATRGNVCVIMRWDLVLTTVGRVHDKRLKWLGSQPVPNVLRHVPNVSKRSPGCNYWPRFAERKAQPRRAWSG
jgi:hypothetical protein